MVKNMKFFLICAFMCFHMVEINAQNLPSIKSFTWGMKYENVLKKLQMKKIDYIEYNEEETSIICDDYHLLMSQIGLSEGYNTIFRFNSDNELFGIVVLMRQDKFDELQEDDIINNVTDFLKTTNIEWQFLRKKYGEETFKNMPDVSKNDVEQQILWSFDDGAIEMRRAWYGTYRKCKDFVFYVAIQCETYED